MKLLIVSQSWYPDSFSGSAHVAAEQARRLATRGHEITVFTEWWDSLYSPEERQGNIRIIRYADPNALKRYGSSVCDLQFLPTRVEALMAQEKFDAAIIHHAYPGQGFFWARPKIPSMYVFHASTARETEVEGMRRKFRGPMLLFKVPIKLAFIAITGRVEKYVLSRVSKIAVFSEYSRGILEGSYPEALSKVTRIGIGIDTKLFQPARSRAVVKKRLGFGVDDEILITVRRLTPRMGIAELFKAMSLVLAKHPNARLLVIGEGPLQEQLSAAAQASELRGRVQVIGRVPLDELPQYYQSADCFVLPTEAFEGLGMATLEALSSGLPVVGTPAGATPEILGKLDSKLITKSTKADDLAHGINSFLDRSDEDKKQISLSARDLVMREYSWDRAIDELEKVVNSIL